MMIRQQLRAMIVPATLLLSVAALAQSPDSQTAKPQLEGSVVSSVNGQLLPRAMVIARNLKSQGTNMVRADDNAHFAFDHLEPGSYQLTASKQGYFTDDRKAYLQQVVDIAAGARISDILIRLVPLGTVSGRVVDESNDPVRRVELRLLSLDHYRGRQTFNLIGSAVTDDRGEYRIFDVRPGTYYLLAEFNLTGEWAKIIGALPAKRSPADLAYPPVFYPGTSDLPQAQKLLINAGDELHADFSLYPIQAVSIEGRVVNGLTGRPVATPMVTAYWGNNTAVMVRNGEISEKDNSFEIRGIGPGTYTLRTSFLEDGETYTDERTVEIGSEGMRNLLIAGLPDFDILGHVRIENARYSTWTPSVEFASTGVRVGNIFRVGAMRPDFHYTAKLHPGNQYRVNVPNLPQDFYLKSVQVAGHEVANTDVVIGGRHTEVELLVSPSGGHIEGATLDEKKEPVPASYVLLVPDGEKINPDLIRSVRTDKKGKFVVRGVPPGTYKLFSFEDIEINDLINQPELLKNYETNAQIVKVEENGKYNLELKPVPVERASGN
jgi:hypothetical protein